MPVFIELVTDSFEKNFATQKANATAGSEGRSSRAGLSRTRRPMRGLEIKEDTYAYLKVVLANGYPFDLFDSGSESGRTEQYANFLLQSVQEARMEKHQIVDTFGEAYIFFFGEQPRFLDVTAILINSHDFNWEAEFWANYDKYLRGTKLVEMGARTYLFYDDNVVEGYWLSAQAVKTADQPLSVQLSFRLFLTNVSNVSLIGEPNFPIRSSVYLPPDVDLRTADGFTLARSANAAVAAAAADQVQSLTGALRGALGQGSGADISGLLRNADELMGDFSAASFRSTPVRSLITDNFDEYTRLPSPIGDIGAEGEDEDGEMTAVDSLPAAALDELEAHGADIDPPPPPPNRNRIPITNMDSPPDPSRAPMTNMDSPPDPDLRKVEEKPSLLERLGLAPHPWSQGGPGWQAGGVTFGPVGVPGGIGPTGVPTGIRLGGVGAGSAVLGGSGRAGTFLGGVQVGGGLFGGVGVGGGVAGGLRGSASGQLTGAASFRGSANLAASYAGTGLGASSVVGGRPSAFSYLVVNGTLKATGGSGGFLSVSANARGPGFSKSFHKTWPSKPDPSAPPDPTDDGRFVG